jgi:hypothetical protein
MLRIFRHHISTPTHLCILCSISSPLPFLIHPIYAPHIRIRSLHRRARALRPNPLHCNTVFLVDEAVKDAFFVRAALMNQGLRYQVLA